MYNRRNGANTRANDEFDDLLVFGYSCRIYPNDERAEAIAEERHLQPWNDDPENRVDRYDCRLMLSSIDESVTDDEEVCPTEEMEEEMCDEERYKELHKKIESGELEEKERKEESKGAEIHFSYNTLPTTSSIIKEDSDSEDEPFTPPVGIKLPVGLTLPENQKQNHIIERTAIFVVSKGPQMEVVIKAKQRNNPEQFGFLEFDHSLYPYYKYISKLIREKKYTPNFSKSKSIGNSASSSSLSNLASGQPDKKSSGALAAIAADSDSDCELHPSLFAKKRTPSPDVVHRLKNAAGPLRRPESPPPEKLSDTRKDYDVSKGSDMYSALFKSLAQINKPAVTEPVDEKVEKPIEVTKPEPSVHVTVTEVKQEKSIPELMHMQVSIEDVLAHRPTQPDVEWQQWWLSFYGTPPPTIAPKPMLPPPPDLEPIVSKYAELVARHGAELENSLKNRVDLQLEFMHSTSLHFSYYQHRVRYVQWEIAKNENQMASLHAQSNSPSCSSPGVGEAEASSALNRKQRRRLQNAMCVGPTAPPGVIDPLTLVAPPPPGLHDIHKTQSSPAIMDATAQPTLKPYLPSTPVSFSLAPVKEETQLAQANLMSDDPIDELEESPSTSTSAVPAATSESSIQGLISLPPKPPAIQNNTQLDRKEKARVFMEKLLNEKKAQRAKVLEDEKIQELERKKAELEKALELENTKEDIGKKREPIKAGKTLDVIDHIINSRIENILQSSGFATKKDDKEESDDSEGSERKRRKRKKDKDRRRSRSRTRSRSRSRDRDRDYDRRREKRRRRSRSRSRSRSRDRYRRRR